MGHAEASSVPSYFVHVPMQVVFSLAGQTLFFCLAVWPHPQTGDRKKRLACESKLHCGYTNQGGDTPIDTIVRAATAIFG